MAKIRPDDLIKFNERGLVPGPEETEEDFLKRIENLDHFFSYPPDTVDDFLTDGDWIPSHALTQRLFGFSPDWVVAHYSNQKLPFFQGAATWLIDMQGIQIPLIQLKKKFQDQPLYKIYHKEEVLAHESVHAARMAFDEPKFEEIFAYMTAKSSFRRFLGAVFQKSWESYLFLFLLLASLALQLLISPLTLFFLLPWMYFALLVVRLSFLRFKLRACLKKFPVNALPLAVRLTDKEIFYFAKSSEAEIREYIRDQSSLRWKMLSKVYNLR